jgi:superfamily I DNA/RNA helicase
VERLVRHWTQWNSSDLSGPQTDRITGLLAPTTALRRRLRTEVAAAEAELIQLTRQQIGALRALRSVRRCVVRGGAGTGKTLLAIEKAHQMAREGGRVLLTCFNGPLADQVAAECSDAPGVSVSTFHALALSRARAARLSIPSNPSPHWWECDAPNLIARSLEVAPSSFDALVVDEAQDFCDAWITALQLLLAEPDASPVFMFLDSHQQLYSRSLTLPEWFVYELDKNCRNTLPIARRVASVFDDPAPDEGATGRNPVFVELSDPAEAPSLVQEVVDRLVSEEGLRPSQVVVLAEDRATVDALHELVVADSCFVPLGGKGVVAETVHRFKGLEAEVVVLVIPTSSAPSRDALLYVGMSRARSMLVVLGPKSVRNRFDLR